MLRYLAPFLPFFSFFVGILPAYAQHGDGPPISITSPDSGDTYVEAKLKNQSLVWDKNRQVLSAVVTFIESNPTEGSGRDDSHTFTLPGVWFDPAQNLFVAYTAKGEAIPVAKYKKLLFTKIIAVLPNANIRVMRQHGAITVLLEAISPNDPAMHAPPASGDGTQSVPIDKLFK